jgi:hypothetical protein
LACAGLIFRGDLQPNRPTDALQIAGIFFALRAVDFQDSLSDDLAIGVVEETNGDRYRFRKAEGFLGEIEN